MKRKSNTKDETLVCPACRREVDKFDLTKTVGRKVSLWGKVFALEQTDLKHFESQWACDECLASGNAIRGTPEAQQYCDFNPHLAFFDVSRTCEKCKEEFIFKKDEQKFFYETLKFWVQAKLNHCPTCREEKKLKKELSALLKDKEKLKIADLERLAEIYAKINNPEKSNYYKRRAKKLSNKTNIPTRK